MSVYDRNGWKWVRFQVAGITVRRSARTRSKRVAEKYEAELREEFGRLRRGGRPRHTFNELMARMITEHFPTLKESAARRYKVSIQAMKPHFDQKPLDKIGKRMISDYVAKRRREVKDPTIRRDLACLSMAFTLGDGWDMCEGNPVKSLNKRHIREGKPRTRFLSHEEYRRLMRAAKPHLVPIIRFAVATGLRLEEQCSLTWKQVDMAAKTLRVVGTKSGTDRIILLNDEATDVLKGIIPRLGSPYVFCRVKDGTRYKRFTRGLAGAAKRAKVTDLQWHDLRRTYGTWFLQEHPHQIKALSVHLGHSSVVVTERHYAFLGLEGLKAAQGAISAADKGN